VLNDQINYRFYVKEQREKVLRFLGGFKDIERLEKGLTDTSVFYKRLIGIFENNMLALGLNASISVHKIDSGLVEVPVYYIGLFSKQFATNSTVQDAELARNVQFDLFTSSSRLIWSNPLSAP
jgi:hypothetical protein